MRPRKTFQPRHQFVDARVVLHGAGAQRIHAEVDGVVPGGKPGEVADHVDLTDLREAVDLTAYVLRAERLGRIYRRHVERRKLVPVLAGRAELEDQRLVLYDVLANLFDHD